MAEQALKTPQQWCDVTGIRILDPDGWRIETNDSQVVGLLSGDTTWETRITRQEFLKRARLSSVMRWPFPLWDEVQGSLHG